MARARPHEATQARRTGRGSGTGEVSAAPRPTRRPAARRAGVRPAAYFAELADLLATEGYRDLKGLTLLFWATGSWWIPLLLIPGVWRYLIRRFPFQSDPLYWGMMFPLGMYTVCTDELVTAMNLPFLIVIAQFFLCVTLLAWVATFISSLTQDLVPTFTATIRSGSVSPRRAS